MPASLVAVFLFVELAKRVLERYAVALAALLFAGAALATAYAAIAKPYSFDLAFVIGIYLATLAVLRKDDKNWPALVLAGLGILGPLFSFASVFAIAASATVLVLIVVDHGRAKRLARGRCRLQLAAAARGHVSGSEQHLVAHPPIALERDRRLLCVGT